ncbi:uncharacterized protein PHALS_06996 [Plasmopara halstedii]|uniref:Uncharacterized protein n=1 Tax=Plasmopara halstedii TaxID=4781 RepID=A0A0P1B391_PLAHL|nr:uncharacterized protein PHALS_06996 [Plasmopara halstedii]CEG49224.1 hypothetical protein PHALS_06996 [Plasmopara halstedii]|eukprot:XP_024585593.1 hypothetical protein PHALS_06996 [Plasmopara halstedii]
MEVDTPSATELEEMKHPFQYPMVFSSNGPSQAPIRQYASLRNPPVALEDRLGFSGERNRPHRLELDQARL